MAKPHAHFLHDENGATATFHDHSTAHAPAHLTKAEIATGDGHTVSVPIGGTAQHTYAQSGTYHVVETVTDSHGEKDTTSASVVITVPSSGGNGGNGGGGGGSGGGGGGGGAGGGGGGFGGGGGGAATGPYTVTTQSQTIQQLETGEVLDVMQVGFRTNPHGAVSQVYVPFKDWQDGKTGNYAAPVAAAIEQLLSLDYVTRATYGQDVDPSTNLLTGHEAFTVSYTPDDALTPMTTTVRIPIAQLAQGAAGAPTEAVNAAYAQLRQTAGR